MILKNAKILMQEFPITVDISIKEGKFQAFGREFAEEGEEILDAKNHYVLAKPVDLEKGSFPGRKVLEILPSSDEKELEEAFREAEGIFAYAKGEQVERAIYLCRRTRTPLHFLSLSSLEDLEQLRDAKSLGDPITAGLRASDLEGEGELVEAFWEALAYGVIDSLEASERLLWRAVDEGKLSFKAAQEVMCQKPAKIAGLEGKGEIALGFDADYWILERE